VQQDIERALILKCRAGDARFFEPIVRAYEPQGLRLATGMLGNPEDARDVLQEAFVKAFQALRQFEVERAFAPWFFQILRNQCRDWLRGRKVRFQVEALDHGVGFTAASGDVERYRQAVARSDAQRILWKALGELPIEQRELLVLKEIEGFRYAEIASILDIQEGTVASRLFAARQALRQVLETQGATYP
jgi:RNA polymerase sigma-70 factor (ECF subfamily)